MPKPLSLFYLAGLKPHNNQPDVTYKQVTIVIS